MDVLYSSTPTQQPFNACRGVEDVADLRSFSPDLIRSKFLYHPVEKAFISIISPLLSIFGVIGNGAFLFIVAKLPEMRTYTNAFLVNVAVCDIIFISTLMYNIVGVYIYSPDIESDPYDSNAGCVVVFGLIHIAHYSSTWLIVLMSLERYLGICRPLQHRYLATKSRIRNLIILAWIIGLLFSSFVVPRFGKIEKLCILWPDDKEFLEMPKVVGECEPAHPFFEVIPLVIQAIPFFVAAIFMVFIYGSIMKKLHTRLDDKSLKNSNTGDGQTNNDARTVRNQVARLLIITGSVFIICYLPYYVIGLNDALLELSQEKIGFQIQNMQLFHLISRQLLTINAVANPVIYSLSNVRYRKAFVSVFSCSNIREGRSSSSSSSNATIDINTFHNR